MQHSQHFRFFFMLMARRAHFQMFGLACTSGDSETVHLFVGYSCSVWSDNDGLMNVSAPAVGCLDDILILVLHFLHYYYFQ